MSTRLFFVCVKLSQKKHLLPGEAHRAFCSPRGLFPPREHTLGRACTRAVKARGAQVQRTPCEARSWRMSPQAQGRTNACFCLKDTEGVAESFHLEFGAEQRGVALEDSMCQLKMGEQVLLPWCWKIRLLSEHPDTDGLGFLDWTGPQTLHNEMGCLHTRVFWPFCFTVIEERDIEPSVENRHWYLTTPSAKKPFFYAQKSAAAPPASSP